MSKEITQHELVQLLTKLAVGDLSSDSEIYDHPCSIAIRRMEESEVYRKDAKRIISGFADNLTEAQAELARYRQNEELLLWAIGASSPAKGKILPPPRHKI